MFFYSFFLLYCVERKEYFLKSFLLPVFCEQSLNFLAFLFKLLQLRGDLTNFFFWCVCVCVYRSRKIKFHMICIATHKHAPLSLFPVLFCICNEKRKEEKKGIKMSMKKKENITCCNITSLKICNSFSSSSFSPLSLSHYLFPYF